MLPAPDYIDSDDYSTIVEASELEGGFCWKKVFTKPTPEDWRRWMYLDLMKMLSKTYRYQRVTSQLRWLALESSTSRRPRMRQSGALGIFFNYQHGIWLADLCAIG